MMDHHGISGRGIFVTGTDTGIGKTHVSVRLIEALHQAGFRVAGMKPVASGAEWVNGRWVNADAQALISAATEPHPYDWVNPFVYEPPIAPHLAAEKAGSPVRFDRIRACYERLVARSDLVVVEGVGGWLVPLNGAEDLSDLARYLGLPVLMVVGIRLGAINHARMTHALIQQSGVPFLGWVANHGLPGGSVSLEMEDALAVSLGCPPLFSLLRDESGSDCGACINNPMKIVEILRQKAP